jgi:hypothetical protein
MVADLTLDNVVLKDLLSKKLLEPAARRTAVSYTIEEYRISDRRAGRLAGISWTSRPYQPNTNRDEASHPGIRELARERQRFGRPRRTALLRREDWVKATLAARCRAPVIPIGYLVGND